MQVLPRFSQLRVLLYVHLFLSQLEPLDLPLNLLYLQVQVLTIAKFARLPRFVVFGCRPLPVSFGSVLVELPTTLAEVGEGGRLVCHLCCALPGLSSLLQVVDLVEGCRVVP